MRTRVLSAIVGITLLLGIIYAGGLYIQGFFIGLGLLALYEFYRMMAAASFSAVKIPGYLLLIVLMLSPLYPEQLLVVILLLLIPVICYAVFYYPKVNINSIALSFFGAFYIGFLLSFAIRMTDLRYSFWIILLSFLLTWASDIGGYFAGTIWGKHKMAPLLSPNKTWEGSIGGVILTLLVSFVFIYLFEFASLGYAYALLLGITASVAAQVGDLFMSSVKRTFGVKDTGNILPGHGGVLDRFDSYLMVLPIVYYFYIYII